jgi:hypothetical protein
MIQVGGTHDWEIGSDALHWHQRHALHAESQSNTALAPTKHQHNTAISNPSRKKASNMPSTP